MKRVAVIVRKSPFNTLRNSECLRMSVGLTLAENAVRVMFIDDGVYLLADVKPEVIGSPEVRKHIEMLLTLGHELFADKQSLEERGLNAVASNIAVRERQEIVELISQSDVVIAY